MSSKRERTQWLAPRACSVDLDAGRPAAGSTITTKRPLTMPHSSLLASSGTTRTVDDLRNLWIWILLVTSSMNVGVRPWSSL
jgi:hypothetical protein